MTQNGVVDLDQLTKEKHVKLNGQDRVVRDVDGVGYQLLQKMKEEGKEASIITMYTVAARCLGMEQEEVLKLNAAQVGKVVELASANADQVEASIPKRSTAGKKATP